MSYNNRHTSTPGGLTVVVHNNDIERAIRQLKKKVMSEGVLKDLKKSQAFESKGTKRRRQKNEAKRRYAKQRRLQEKFL